MSLHPPTDLTYLDRLLIILKRHGASHFDDGNFRIDLATPIGGVEHAAFKTPSANDIAEADAEQQAYESELAAWRERMGKTSDPGIDG